MALIIVNPKDMPPAREVRPQMKNGRKAAVHNQRLYSSPDRTVLRTRYDPGLVLDRHSHLGDEVIYVMDGDLMVGDQYAGTGATIILEQGTAFGPLRAGHNGTTILEVFIGPSASTPKAGDKEAYKRLLKEEGITLLAEPDPSVKPVLET